MLRFSRGRRVGVIATAAVLALAAASAFCYDIVVRHDREMLRVQSELRRLHELSKVETQQQNFWRDHGVERSDLVGVSDTIAYDRAFAKNKCRSGWRVNKTLAQLDPQLSEAFKRLALAAAQATQRRCLEFLPRMEAELAETASADDGQSTANREEIQRRWMRACRARCAADVHRLMAELIPSPGGCE